MKIIRTHAQCLVCRFVLVVTSSFQTVCINKMRRKFAGSAWKILARRNWKLNSVRPKTASLDPLPGRSHSKALVVFFDVGCPFIGFGPLFKYSCNGIKKTQ